MTTNAELKRLAEHATPGPWLYADNAPMSYGTAWINSDDVKSLAICDGTRRSETHGFCLQMNKDENERNARYIAAANPARVIALVDECEKHERTIARLNRQASTSRTFWLRAARAALNGDLRELRNRVDMADAPPVDVVLSLATGEGE